MGEDQTFKLPITKKDVTIKGYASYKTMNEIRRIINEGMSPTVTGADNAEKSEVSVDFDANSRLDAEQRTLELMVVSFDSSTDDVYKRLEELPDGDVEFLVDKINKVTNASAIKKTEKKS